MAHQTFQLVKNLISSDFAVIFSKTFCPHCRSVKRLLHKLEESYTSYELDKRKDGDAIQDVLEQITGARTVPRVFINGECVGGATDFQNLYSNGTLQNILKKKSRKDKNTEERD